MWAESSRNVPPLRKRGARCWHSRRCPCALKWPLGPVGTGSDGAGPGGAVPGSSGGRRTHIASCSHGLRRQKSQRQNRWERGRREGSPACPICKRGLQPGRPPGRSRRSRWEPRAGVPAGLGSRGRPPHPVLRWSLRPPEGGLRCVLMHEVQTWAAAPWGREAASRR